MDAKKEYIERINRVVDHIKANLVRNISVSELADVAAFSEFHFHRIFKAFTGESVNRYITRLRLQNAAHYLITNKQKNITEVAIDCGFSSSANFTKAFKKLYDVSPSDYRTDFENSRIGKAESRNGKDIFSPGGYIDCVDNNLSKEIEMKVNVKEMQPVTVAFIRFFNGYDPKGISEVWRELKVWATARDLLKEDTLLIGLGLDNPEVTDPEKCRYDACISVSPDTETGGAVGMQEIAGGKYAVGEFEGEIQQLAKFYHDIYASWLPENGYVPDCKPPFEIYHDNGIEKDGKTIYRMDICIAVRPL